MRSYVIKDIKEDISFVPYDSFIYNDGCGFVKRNNDSHIGTYEQAKEKLGEERWYCTSNLELNPVYGDSRTQFPLSSATTLRFIMDGVFHLDKGATITEIEFMDIFGNKMDIDESAIHSEDLYTETYWNNQTEWGKNKLFDGNKEYTDSTNCKSSSTIFNLDAASFDVKSEFYITLTPEQMEVLGDIKVAIGSPEGRVPRVFDIWAVIHPDDEDQRAERLIFRRIFDETLDSRGVLDIIAGDNIDKDAACEVLFERGFNDDGIFMVMNDQTGLLEPIFCEFPQYLIDPDSELGVDLCSKYDGKFVVTEFDNDTGEWLADTPLSDYLKMKDYICTFKSCQGLEGAELEECKKSICKKKKFQDNSEVEIIDENGELVNIPIADYAASLSIACEDTEKKVACDDPNLTFAQKVACLEEHVGPDASIEMVDPATGAKKEYTLTELKRIVEAEEDGGIDKIDFTEIPLYYEPETNTFPEISATNPLNLSLGKNPDLTNFDLDSPFMEFDYQFVAEYEMEQVFDIDGFPMFDEDGRPIMEEVKYITVSITGIKPKGNMLGNSGYFNGSLSRDSDKMGAGDGLPGTNNKFKIRQNFLVIEDITKEERWTTELDKLGRDLTLSHKPFLYKKSFDYDCDGITIAYYGAKSSLNIECTSSYFNVEHIENTNKEGVIKLVFNVEDISIIEFPHEFKLTIDDSFVTHEIELEMRKHLRLFEENNHNITFDLGIMNEGDELDIPIFAASINEEVKILNEKEFIIYNNVSPSGGLCNVFKYGIDMNISTDETKSPMNVYSIVGESTEQQFNVKKYYLIDPYYNYVNMKDPEIKIDHVHVIELYVQTLKDLRVDNATNWSVGRRVPYVDTKDIVINIDKFRWFNSRNNWERDLEKGSNLCRFSDFRIIYQKPGLKVSYDNPDQNILGLREVKYCKQEYDCWIGEHDGMGSDSKPIKYIIEHDEERFLELGTVVINIEDMYSSASVTVNVEQFLDIDLQFENGVYPINTNFYETITFKVYHPYNWEWQNLKILNAGDFCNYEFSQPEGDYCYCTLTFNKVGEHTIEITDGHRILIIPMNVQYANVVTMSKKRVTFEVSDLTTSPIQTVELLNRAGSDIEFMLNSPEGTPGILENDIADISYDSVSETITITKKEGVQPGKFVKLYVRDYNDVTVYSITRELTISSFAQGMLLDPNNIEIVGVDVNKVDEYTVQYVSDQIVIENNNPELAEVIVTGFDTFTISARDYGVGSFYISNGTQMFITVYYKILADWYINPEDIIFNIGLEE